MENQKKPDAFFLFLAGALTPTLLFLLPAAAGIMLNAERTYSHAVEGGVLEYTADLGMNAPLGHNIRRLQLVDGPLESLRTKKTDACEQQTSAEGFGALPAADVCRDILLPAEREARKIAAARGGNPYDDAFLKRMSDRADRLYAYRGVTGKVTFRPTN